MDPLLLAGVAAGLAVVVLLLLLATRARLSTLEERLTDLSHAAATRQADEGEDKESVEGLRKLVAMMAAGKPVDAEMVRENRLYRTAKPADISRGAGRGRGSPT